MRVFDSGAMEQMLRRNPAAALRTLADAVEREECKVRLLNVMPIAGHQSARHDTVRLTLDVDVQLVQVTSADRTDGR